MKLAKEKIKVILLRNKNVVIGVLIFIVLALAYAFFYLDVFGIDFFNQNRIRNLEAELRVVKHQLNETVKFKAAIKGSSADPEVPGYAWLFGVLCLTGCLIIIVFGKDAPPDF